MKYIANRPDFIENDLSGNREIPVHSQRQGAAFSGEEYPDEGITVPQQLVELLLQQAAHCELPVEDIVIQSIRNYMERSENRGR